MQHFDSATIGLACAKVKDAFAVAIERLEINDYDGEEAEHLEAVADGEAALRNELLPILAEAPAMLAALRQLRSLCDGDSEMGQICAAILARIDGTPTAQPVAPSGEIAGKVAKVKYIITGTYQTKAGNIGTARLILKARDHLEAMDKAGQRIAARKSYMGKLDMSCSEWGGD
jgi:hypothetical protein